MQILLILILQRALNKTQQWLKGTLTFAITQILLFMVLIHKYRLFTN